MQKITPFLWFDDQAEEAVSFYVTLFENSRITHVSYYGLGARRPEGSAFIVNFVLDGLEMMAINGGPAFTFNPAISLYVDCQTEAEIDRLWSALSAGGEEVQCGWLRDRYGISWQIVPSHLSDYVAGPDKAGAQRAMQAMLQMKKLDIDAIRHAYEQG